MGRQDGAAIENQGGSAASPYVELPIMPIVVVNSCADLQEFGVPGKLLTYKMSHFDFLLIYYQVLSFPRSNIYQYVLPSNYFRAVIGVNSFKIRI